ncbi:MAG: hypothetical protein ACXADY_20905 [Candidatus Hodarchaeales archaeon]|jgi:hypothetical protein
MGRTLPSYRRNIEKERSVWQSHYAARLREPHRTSFTELWLYVFQLADAASTNTRPVLMDNILFSMLIAQQSEIQRLKKELNRISRRLARINVQSG